jgi:hypothetical protein
VWVSGALDVIDVGAEVADGALSLPDEHAASDARATSATVAAVRRGYLPMPPIYATLAAVTEHPGFLECCWA